jgi:selenocysteine-specific elongation factor
VQRGQVIVNETFATNSNTWDVLLERSPRASGRGIKDNALVRVHFGSGNSEGRIVFLDAKNLSSGEKALAQIRFDEPVFAFTGDRFIIRDTVEQQTLAGGIILSAEANRRHFHTPERKRFLDRRAAKPNDPSAFAASEIERDRFVRKDGLLLNARFSAADIANAVQTLAANKALVVSGDFAADAKWWNDFRDRAVTLIDRAHHERPNEAGASLNELRASLDCSPEAFDALVVELCENGFVQSGVTISRQTHRLELPPHLKNAAEKIRGALTAKPLDPPSVKEIASDAPAQQALRFLLQTGEAVELSKEIVLNADAYKRASEEVRRMLIARDSATTSELRQGLGTSRRVIIPLLEYLDKQGITRREGDKRVLGKA